MFGFKQSNLQVHDTYFTMRGGFQCRSCAVELAKASSSHGALDVFRTEDM